VHSIGINIHLSYFQTAYGRHFGTIIMPRLLELGVRHVRDGGVVVPSDPWMELVYGRMKDLSASGIRFNLVLRPPLGSQDYTTADHLDRLLEYAGPAIESFEGLNEHDLSRRPDWVTEVRSFQRAIYTRLKEDLRTASLPLLGPSMGRPDGAAQVGDLSRFMNYGSLHPYPGGDRPMASVAVFVAQGRKLNGGRPMVVTETGYHTADTWTGGHPYISEEAMARYVPRVFLDYFNAGFAKTYLYELIDEGNSRAEREQAFGLLRDDGTPKPAFYSLRNLIAVLRDPGSAFTPGKLGYQLSGDTTNVRRLLLQKRDGRFYLILWHDAYSWGLVGGHTSVPSAKMVRLQLDGPAIQIRSIATLNSTETVDHWVGTASIVTAVPDSPVVLEIIPQNSGVTRAVSGP
jgi:hypothetical protein